MRNMLSTGSVLAAAVLSAALTLGAAAPATAATGDRALARAGVLVQADFPDGWTSTPRGKEDTSVDKIAKTIPTCRAYAAVEEQAQGNTKAKSPEFVQGEDDQVENTVSVYSSVAKATAAAAAVDQPRSTTCLRTLFRKVIDRSVASDKQAKANISSIDVVVTPLDVAPAGDDAFGFQLVVTVLAKDASSFELTLQAEFVRVGRVIDALTTQASPPLDPTLLPSLVDASVGRIEAAGA